MDRGQVFGINLSMGSENYFSISKEVGLAVSY